MWNEDNTIKEISWNIKEKFNKCWKKYSVGLAFRFILNPWLKDDFIKYCYTKLNPLTFEDKTKNVIQKIQMLYREYASNFSICGVSLS